MNLVIGFDTEVHRDFAITDADVLCLYRALSTIDQVLLSDQEKKRITILTERLEERLPRVIRRGA